MIMAVLRRSAGRGSAGSGETVVQTIFLSIAPEDGIVYKGEAMAAQHIIVVHGLLVPLLSGLSIARAAGLVLHGMEAFAQTGIARHSPQAAQNSLTNTAQGSGIAQAGAQEVSAETGTARAGATAQVQI